MSIPGSPTESTSSNSSVLLLDGERGRQLVEALKSDLNLMATEARKKATPLRLAVERALVRLSTVGSLPPTSILPEMLRAKDLMQSFLLGLEETKNPRVVQLSMACIHRMIDTDAIDHESKLVVLERLQQLASTGQEEIKILQCVLSLVTTSPDIRGDDLAQAVALCFRLHFVKDVMTAAIAAASLRQLVAAVFERVAAEDRNASEAVDSPRRHAPAAGDAYLLFQDLCLLTNGESPHWLQGLTEMTRTLGLELIETALLANPDVILRHVEFGHLLKERVCALVIKLFSPSIQQGAGARMPVLLFPVAVRLMHVLLALIQHYHSLIGTECEIFLTMLLKFLDADKLLWQRSMALEVLLELFKKPEFLLLLTTMVMHKSAVPGQLFERLYQLGAKTIATGDDKLALLSAHQGKVVVINLLDKNDSPQISPSYLLSVIFAIVQDAVKCISSLVQMDQADPHTDTVIEEESPETEGERRDVAPLLEMAGRNIISLLDVLLAFATVETATDGLLRSLQSLLRVTAQLKLVTLRQQVVNSLCRHCLPDQFSFAAELPSGGWNVTRKHLQVVYVLFNSALCLGAYLDDSWTAVIGAMQQLVAVLDLPHPETTQLSSAPGARILSNSQGERNSGVRRHHRRTSSSGSTSGSNFMTMTASAASELPGLAAMLAQVFAMSHNLSKSALYFLISALCKQSERTIDLLMSSQNVPTLSRNDAQLFPVRQLQSLGLANLNRIMEFWPTVTAHLIEVAFCEDAKVKLEGVEALTTLVHEALVIPRDPPVEASPGLQQAILSPLRNLSKVQNVQVARRQLECVKKVLDSCGQSLSHAWPVVIGIINDVMATTNANSDATTPVAVNVALTAVELLWNVADYLHQNRVSMQERLDTLPINTAQLNTVDEDGLPTHVSLSRLWVILFQQLARLCLDSRADVRRSACQTFFLTINTHAAILELDAFQEVIVEILQPLLQDIQAAAARDIGADTSTDYGSAAKQWAETKCLTMAGLGQLMVGFVQRLLEIEAFNQLWDLALELLAVWINDLLKEVAKASADALLVMFGCHVALGHGTSPMEGPVRRGFQTWVKVVLDASRRQPPHREKTLIPLAGCVEPLMLHLQASLTDEQAAALLNALRHLMDCHHADVMSIVRLSDLQAATLTGVQQLLPSSSHPHVDHKHQLMAVQELRRYITYAIAPPFQVNNKSIFLGLSAACCKAVAEYMATFGQEQFVVTAQLQLDLLTTLTPILANRFFADEDCKLWQAAHTCAIATIDHGLRGLATWNTILGQTDLDQTWTALLDCIEVSFFPERSADTRLLATGTFAQIDSTVVPLDLDMVTLIQDALLPNTRSHSKRGSSAAGTDVVVPPHALSRTKDILTRATKNIGNARRPLSEAAVKALIAADSRSAVPAEGVSSDAETDQAGHESTGTVANLTDGCLASLKQYGQEPGDSRLKHDLLVLLSSLPAMITPQHRPQAKRLYQPLLHLLCTSDDVALRDAAANALRSYEALL
ncbi:uncharacterized protein MONBRDRAFT_32420 [Monosiga brevicollis MX1]|uniref:Protein MON2 homolog n=1 Tax=Monosiga brevicollis TaxID=81824 RepID=A9UZF0_MONBE|nr:uncharacterized protein MONBRDRAFT_32420 [Monosiga brevicollis MX1]EDQ89355.1 predicted protein [Monosiga brevicollis MX1]|eukprot:XP_001745931.1 hypothetical protein [Monosiga brevicollis MX1]